MKSLRLLFLVLLAFLSCGSAQALSFNLDSIAEWGKFPRFVVNTYRWGDKFFNGYGSNPASWVSAPKCDALPDQQEWTITKSRILLNHNLLELLA